MTKPTDTIESREPRYGDYYERSDLKERIIEAFSEGRNWMGLEPDARNSLFMIADKLSRILNGDPDDPDSWHDIGGYAGLVEGRLTNEGMKEYVGIAVDSMRFEFGSGPFALRGYPIAGDSDGDEPTRCPYFTGEPPEWSEAPEWADLLVQDAHGRYKWTPNGASPAGFVWIRPAPYDAGGHAGNGPHNPNWKLAIEPRPETHK